MSDAVQEHRHQSDAADMPSALEHSSWCIWPASFDRHKILEISGCHGAMALLRIEVLSDLDCSDRSPGHVYVRGKVIRDLRCFLKPCNACRALGW